MKGSIMKAGQKKTNIANKTSMEKGNLYRKEEWVEEIHMEIRKEGKQEIRNGKENMYRNKEWPEEIHKDRRTEGQHTWEIHTEWKWEPV